MSGYTPAQAAAHAFVTGCVNRGITVSNAAVPAECQLGTVKELWADVAQAAITAQEAKPVPDGEPLTHFFHCWRFPDHHACAVALIERQAEENDRLLAKRALATERPAPDLATAVAERDRDKARADRNSARNAVCNLLDLFGAPDDRLMQHASATRATLQRYATDAGVRLDGRAST